MRARTGQPEVEGGHDHHQQTQDSEAGTALSVGDLLQVILRYKWFTVACMVVCLAIAGVYLLLATPIYEASASLRIDPNRASSLGLNDLLSGSAFTNGDMLATEIAIVKSDVVAISTLNSLSDADFKQYAGVDKGSMALPASTSASQSFTPAQEALLFRFKKALSAKQLEGTQLVGITFRDPNPKTAATIVNHVIASYLKQSFDSRYGSVTQVTDWLSNEMTSLKDRAAEAQKKLAAFQEKNNILGTDATNNTTIDRLRLLNNRLAEAQSERIVKEAQMRAASSGSPAVLASLFPSANLNSLQGEQANLYAKYAQLSAKFGPSYPPLVQTKREMQQIDSQINRVVGTVKSRLNEDYNASLRAENMLQHEYDEQTGKAYALNRQQAEYAVLQAEGSSSRDLYDTLQYKLQQAGIVAGLNGINTMLVDSARPPLRPIEPKKPIILVFGLCLGLFAGVGSSFFKEAISDKVQSGQQIERVTKYHLLAAVPRLTTETKANAVPTSIAHSLVALRDPLSRIAESYRTLRNATLLSSLDRPPKTVIVTSALPTEGKSMTAANYAIVLAQKGARVLLIDADLRRPTVHLQLGLDRGVGLGNLLLGETISEPFAYPLKDLTNLAVLTAGRQIPLPSEALASNRFSTILQELEDQFDHVVVDSAPILIVSDILPAAGWADAVVIVVRYNSTPVRALLRMRDILNRADANVAGVVMNDVSEFGADYGEYGYGYYQ